jgi:ADP-heptose:LPS heptosyltransferase
MAEMPQATPIPDKPPLHLRGGYLAIAAPEDPIEACFSVPAVRALRHGRPNASIAVTTPESLAPIWNRVRGITHVVAYPERSSAKAIASLLRETGVEYESSIAWEASKAAKAFASLRIQQRFGYRLPRLVPHLNEPLDFTPPLGPVQHRVRYYLLLTTQLGIDSFQPLSFRTGPLPPTPARPRIALAPGSEFGAAYEWPLDSFAAAATRLQDQHQAELVLLARPKHEQAANKLATNLGERADHQAGSFPLEELLTALESCSVLLASDGILPHLSSFLGVPCVVPFGPGDPEARRPLGRIHTILNRHPECGPCGYSKCPLDHRCMREITSADACAAVSATLERLSTPQR